LILGQAGFSICRGKKAGETGSVAIQFAKKPLNSEISKGCFFDLWGKGARITVTNDFSESASLKWQARQNICFPITSFQGSILTRGLS
jgi:hypothetical protein